MPLVIQDTSVVPPEDWTYLVVEKNHPVRVKNYARLYPEVVTFCMSNGINPPSEQTVIDYLCQTAHIPCYNSESGSLIDNPWTLNLPLPPKLGCCGR